MSLGNTATLRGQATTGATVAIGAAATGVVPLTFAGAAVGDRPIVSAAAVPAGLMIGQCTVVAAANTISVVFVNPTAAPVDVTALVCDVTIIRATGE